MRNDQAPNAGKFQDEFAHDGGVQPSSSSTKPTLISETEAPVLIFDKTSTPVPGICDSKSGPVKSLDKLRSQSITSKFHRTGVTRLIREMFKQYSKRKSVNFYNTQQFPW